MNRLFEDFSKNYFESLKTEDIIDSNFFKSLKYAFFSGGKRLRPKLVLTAAQALGVPLKKVLPVALAVELVHTYSLVHDDLPAMDNDTYRRGKLTNHAAFGEASAVLAGDALLTLAFQVLAEHYKGRLLKNLVLLLSQSSGFQGMVGGQVLDCLTQERSKSIFNKIHYLKTAKLFEFSILAAGLVAELSKADLAKLKKFGKDLGLLFQLQDDLFDESKADERSEENILSIFSKEELLKEIENKKASIENLFANLSFSRSEVFKALLDKISKRTK